MEPSGNKSQEEIISSNILKMREQLFYYALQLTEDHNDAKDLVQETSYKALKYKGKLQHNKHTRAWMYTILRNTYINYLRSGHSRHIISENDESNLQIFTAQLPEGEHPDRIYFRKELREIIEILPTNYSRPLQLFLSGYSYKEISSMMNIPIGTVKSRIHLGKKRIRSAYATA